MLLLFETFASGACERCQTRCHLVRGFFISTTFSPTAVDIMLVNKCLGLSRRPFQREILCIVKFNQRHCDQMVMDGLRFANAATRFLTAI